ncbi:MAG: glycosyltransferase [Betaproteobacteria bacterium]|nr:glycosyltransferase [Betaproteobacteria bacterium]
MKSSRGIQALLVDPSLFTAPYDAALTDGLLSVGVDVMWATRPTRQGDRQVLPASRMDPFFYRGVDETPRLPPALRGLAKGASHILGLCALVWRVLARKPDVVHFQWTVVPCLDALAICAIRLLRPVVLTVHDPVPFNGERRAWLQTWGFDLPIRLANRVIVHTQAGRSTLIERGVPAAKIVVIPHGPLSLAVPLPESNPRERRANDGRWTFLLFGEIKAYKGTDLLIEALGLLPELVRQRARVIVAGRPQMDLGPIKQRMEALGLSDVVEIRARRLSEEEMAALFAETDCFVFPYRQIDASGVYFLVKSLGKWVIASRVGVFTEDLQEGTQGTLVTPGDVRALADALEFALQTRPSATPPKSEDTWAAIGRATKELYAKVMASGETSRPRFFRSLGSRGR